MVAYTVAGTKLALRTGTTRAAFSPGAASNTRACITRGTCSRGVEHAATNSSDSNATFRL